MRKKEQGKGTGIEDTLYTEQQPQNYKGVNFHAVTPDTLQKNTGPGLYTKVEQVTVNEESGIQNQNEIYVSEDLNNEILKGIMAHFAKILAETQISTDDDADTEILTNKIRDFVEGFSEEEQSTDWAEKVREEIIEHIKFEKNTLAGPHNPYINSTDEKITPSNKLVALNRALAFLQNK